MTSWLRRTQAGIQSAPTTPAVPNSAPGFIPVDAGRLRDPNAPDVRLDIESRCIYERRLPKNAYITAHVTRLQDGFYDSPSTHGDRIDNVRFLAVSFVFHPTENENRFQSATVTIGLHDDTDQAFSDPTHSQKPIQEPRCKPKFLRFAPHVLFGGVSPETLDWNFNLTGSLGVSQTPVSASLSPSGGVKGSYKIYQMMRIQGSTRTLRARHHHEYDIEDGEVCWTMEENPLQKSGLPREMTFVMLITKGDVENVVFDINIEPKIASWFGHFPGWWNNLLKYRPLPKEHMDLDKELGQRFSPEIPGYGYNFANLASTFNELVSLPGTTYSLTDHGLTDQVQPVTDAMASQHAAASKPKAPSRQNTQQPNAQSSNSQTNQHPGGQQSAQAVPVTRYQVVPQGRQSQPNEASEAPADYHIYLHNPRTINLHATPPPPSLTPAPDYNIQSSQAFNIIRPHSAAPQQRVASPANTKMKRRSIDITNLKNSPYYDEAKTSMQTQTQTPHRNFSGGRDSIGSLRRRRSKTDLRNSPLVEEQSRSQSLSQSRSRSRSLSASQSPAASDSNNSWSAPSPSQGHRKISPNSIILIAPSPPDPGLSGFKARLKAHAAATREKERDRLPFEVMPQSHRPPREITPSPDPTDNPNSDTTDAEKDARPAEEDDGDSDDTPLPTAPLPPMSPSTSRWERNVTISPEATLTNGELKKQHGEATPGRKVRDSARDTRVRHNTTTSPNSYSNANSNSSFNPSSSSAIAAGRDSSSTTASNTNPNLGKSTTSPSSSPSAFRNNISNSNNTTSRIQPPEVLPDPNPVTSNNLHPIRLTTSPPLPRSPDGGGGGGATSQIRKISPYADVKWDAVRSSLSATGSSAGGGGGPRQRRDSSISLSPDEVLEKQPKWGDLREEQRRRQRKRLSMPLPTTMSMSGSGGGSLSRLGLGSPSPGERLAGTGVDSGYSYITEADGEWDDR